MAGPQRKCWTFVPRRPTFARVRTPRTLRTLVVLARRRLRHSPWLQVAVLMAVWALGDVIVRATGVSIPGGVVGLFLVVGLFATGTVSVLSLRRGARWLLREMLLFFVPAVLAVLDHREFLGVLGLKILLVIVVGTLVVMVVTAMVVEACLRFVAWWQGKRHGVA